MTLRMPPIVVRKSVVEDRDDTTIVSAVVDYINILRQEGAYLNSEMPENALRAYYVDYYLAQVMNGGHAQFIHNSRLQEPELRQIREGLALLDLKPFIEIFRDFEGAFMRDIAHARENGIESSSALDDRFYALDAYKTLMPTNGRWLKGLPETKAVPDADYRRAMDALVAANPSRAARLAQRARATIQYRLSQPLFTAASLVAARMNLRSPSLGGGLPEVDPDGKRHTGWGLSAEQGRGLVFLGEKDIIYVEAFLDDGRRFTDAMARERRDALFAKPREIDRLMQQPKVVYREALRFPASEVQAAIDAAAALPVVEAAEFALSRRAAPGSTLGFLFPHGRRGADGPWIWRAQSAHTSFEICFVGNMIQASEGRNAPFLAFTRDELEAYIAAQPQGHA